MTEKFKAEELIQQLLPSGLVNNFRTTAEPYQDFSQCLDTEQVPLDKPSSAEKALKAPKIRPICINTKKVLVVLKVS